MAVLPSDTVIGFSVWRLLKSWKELVSKSPFTEVSWSMTIYILFGSSIFLFLVLSIRFVGLSPQLQRKTLLAAGVLVKGEEHEGTVTLVHLAITDDTLCYLLYFMFDGLHSSLLNSSLYLEGNGLSRLLQYVLEGRSASTRASKAAVLCGSSVQGYSSVAIWKKCHCIGRGWYVCKSRSSASSSANLRVCQLPYLAFWATNASENA